LHAGLRKAAVQMIFGHPLIDLAGPSNVVGRRETGRNWSGPSLALTGTAKWDQIL
jgi:hypothetical protein